MIKLSRKKLALVTVLVALVLAIFLSQYVHFRIGSETLFPPYAHSLIISISKSKNYQPAEGDALVFIPDYSNALVNQSMVGVVYDDRDLTLLKTGEKGEVASAQPQNILERVIWPILSKKQYQIIKSIPIVDTYLEPQRGIRYVDQTYGLVIRAPISINVNGSFSRGTNNLYTENVFSVKQSNHKLMDLRVTKENVSLDDVLAFIETQPLEFWSSKLNDIDGYLASVTEEEITTYSFLFYKDHTIFIVEWYAYPDEALTNLSEQIVKTLNFLE